MKLTCDKCHYQSWAIKPCCFPRSCAMHICRSCAVTSGECLKRTTCTTEFTCWSSSVAVTDVDVMFSKSSTLATLPLRVSCHDRSLSVVLVMWRHPYRTYIFLRQWFAEYCPQSMWRILQTVTCASVRVYVENYTVKCSSLMSRRLLQRVTCASFSFYVAHYNVS